MTCKHTSGELLFNVSAEVAVLCVALQPDFRKKQRGAESYDNPLRARFICHDCHKIFTARFDGSATTLKLGEELIPDGDKEEPKIRDWNNG